MRNNASKSGGARVGRLDRVGGGGRVDGSREASRGGKGQRGKGRRGLSETETGGSRCEGAWVDALDRASTTKAKAMEEMCGSNLQLPRTRINKGATCRRSRMTERKESSKRDVSRCD